jgi:hypothetical protein
MRDPKQLLLMHVEKVVLAVMLVLLVLVLVAYEPWSITVEQKGTILSKLEDVQKKAKSTDWPDVLTPRAFDAEIETLQKKWWGEADEPHSLAPGKLIFWNLSEKGVYFDRPPDPPPVAPVAAVYAKADRGQVIVVFQIKDADQQKALLGSGVGDYQGGCEFERIEIYRTDRNAPHAKPVLITPEGWLPAGLPGRYGAPAGDELGPRGYFGVPVYIYAQPRPPAAPADEGRRMREEMERRDREDKEKKAEEDRRRREEEIRTTGKDTPEVTTPPARQPQPVPVRTAPPTYVKQPKPGTVGTAEPKQGWYYFVDQGVDPDGRYAYNVVIVVRNPVFIKYKGTDDKVAEFAKSPAVNTPENLEVKVESYKKWFFQGVMSSGQVEMGTFRVRSYIGGRRQFTAEEIDGIVGELSGVTTKAPAPKTKVAEPAGEWIEQSFTVYPGEEIGGKRMVMVAGAREEVDFSTGCFLVSVGQDSQVIETRQTVTVPGAGGMVKEERVSRMVIPKLRCAYMDRRGNLQSRWREDVPPLPKGGAEKPN